MKIPHSLLLDALARLVPEAGVLALVKHWLTTPIQDGTTLHEPSKGVAQGSPISPLLANLYLDHLDEALLKGDHALVRYADDFVILARTLEQAETAMELTEQTLQDLQLRLNSAKTRIVHLDEGLEFLGWHFVRSLAVPRQCGEPQRSNAVWPTPVPTQNSAAPAQALADESVPTAMTLAFAEAQPPLPAQESGEATAPPLATRSDFSPGLPDADPLQRTLYVVEPACEIGKESERLVLRKDGQTLLEVPIIHVDQVMLFGHQAMSMPAMHLCMQQRAPVVLLSRLGRFVGRLDAPDARHVRLLQSQVAACANVDFSLTMAKHFVAAKLHHSALVLARYARTRDSDVRTALHNTVLQLREDRHRIKNAATADSLRGLEGQAAHAHFAGLRVLLDASWGFSRRQKQPPPDPVNAMLSLGYTLLYQCVAGLLQARGLNPYLGFLHASGGDHYALASDLVEEFRAVAVDATVLDMCLNDHFSPADFKVHDEGCTLLPDTVRRFIRKFEEKLGATGVWLSADGAAGAQDLRRRIDQQVQNLVRALHANDANAYEAMRLR